jgi:3-oxoacyl-[acyl-carrier protein] reductase
MDLGLTGRVYILTGATRGLGRATAEALVADGAKVVVSARDEGNVRSAVDALSEVADNCVEGVVADNADQDTADRLVRAADARWGRVDGALISVGGPPAGGPTAIRDEQWRTSFESVFLGAVRLLRAVADACNDGGSIALVLSTSVKAPVGGLAVSNGLRPGLAMLVKDAADELGERGIRVNSLLPGRLETERVQELDSLADDPAAARKRYEAAIPLRRYGDPAEFGKVAAFVLSPAASFVTGSAIAVDGGMMRAL